MKLSADECKGRVLIGKLLRKSCPHFEYTTGDRTDDPGLSSVNMYASTWLCTKIVELEGAVDAMLAKMVEDRGKARRPDTLEELDIGNPAME